MRETLKPCATETAKCLTPMDHSQKPKEQIGGILLLDAQDLNQATELMAKHPGIRVATFEIRALDEESTAKVNSAE